MNTALALTIYDEALKEANDHFLDWDSRTAEDIAAKPYRTPTLDEVQAVLDSDGYETLKGHVTAQDVMLMAEGASRNERAAFAGISFFDDLTLGGGEEHFDPS